MKFNKIKRTKQAKTTNNEKTFDRYLLINLVILSVTSVAATSHFHNHGNIG